MCIFFRERAGRIVIILFLFLSFLFLVKFLDNISRQNIQLSFLLKGIHAQLLRRLSRNLGFLVKFYSRSDSSFEIIKFSPHYLFSYLHLLILSRIQCPKIVSLTISYISLVQLFFQKIPSLFFPFPPHSSTSFSSLRKIRPTFSNFYVSHVYATWTVPFSQNPSISLSPNTFSDSFFAIYPQRNPFPSQKSTFSDS